jgi:NAD dependent epimerase/dehydratase
VSCSLIPGRGYGECAHRISKKGNGSSGNVDFLVGLRKNMNLTGKKILVTGAEGFIGSHLTEMLIDSGYEVRAFVLYNSFNSWGWIDSFPEEKRKKLDVFTGDIRDPFSVKESMKGINVIFHLAALIAIPYSYLAPGSYIDTNISGTLNVLQAAREADIERILVTSTSEVYGTAMYVPIDENHPRQGQSPYSATKIGADALADSFFRSFGLPVTIVRPFNTYGPRQSARAMIPTIISQLLGGKEEISLGALDPTRDLVFVKDTARGFFEIAQSDLLTGQEVNIATEKEISVGDLAHIIIDIINPRARIVIDKARLRPEKSEVLRLLGSSQKLEQTTGWKPATSLEEGLKCTIEWFSDPANLQNYKTGIYNV